MTITEELKPIHSRRKSFYKKAFVTLDSDTESYTLRSYQTIVAQVTGEELTRMWNGWSATTARHIDEFCKQLGFYGIGKHDWESIPVGGKYKLEKLEVAR